jgi:hypothetical protein
VVIALIAFALAVTLLVEVPVVVAFYPGQRRRMAIACAVVTTVTSLVMNVALAFTSRSAIVVAFAQLGALLIESSAYYAVARPRDRARALTAAAAANVFSYAAGLFLG